MRLRRTSVPTSPGPKRSAAIPRRGANGTIVGATVQKASPGEPASLAAGNVGPAIGANAGPPLFASVVRLPAVSDPSPGAFAAGSRGPQTAGLVDDILGEVGLTKEDAVGIWERVQARKDRARPNAPGSTVVEGGTNGPAPAPGGKAVGGVPNAGGAGAAGMGFLAGMDWKRWALAAGLTLLGLFLFSGVWRFVAALVGLALGLFLPTVVPLPGF